jgi:hypothetical protein
MTPIFFCTRSLVALACAAVLLPAAAAARVAATGRRRGHAADAALPAGDGRHDDGRAAAIKVGKDVVAWTRVPLEAMAGLPPTTPLASADPARLQAAAGMPTAPAGEAAATAPARPPIRCRCRPSTAAPARLRG